MLLHLRHFIPEPWAYLIGEQSSTACSLSSAHQPSTLGMCELPYCEGPKSSIQVICMSEVGDGEKLMQFLSVQGGASFFFFQVCPCSAPLHIHHPLLTANSTIFRLNTKRTSIYIHTGCLISSYKYGGLGAISIERLLFQNFIMVSALLVKL